MPESITYSSGKNSGAGISASGTGISATSGAACQAASLGGFKEAVCLNAGRVYDSCSSKDCLEDLRVYMTAPCQALLEQLQFGPVPVGGCPARRDGGRERAV